MLCELPYPTAAAIHSAVLGGGLELAMHCDGLIASPPADRDGKPGRPYPVGLPEAGLSICPGWGGTNLLPARIDPANAIHQTAIGKPMNFDEAKEAGLFDAGRRLARLAHRNRTPVDPRSETPGLAAPGTPSRWIGCPDVAA